MSKEPAVWTENGYRLREEEEEMESGKSPDCCCGCHGDHRKYTAVEEEMMAEKTRLEQAVEEAEALKGWKKAGKEREDQAKNTIAWLESGREERQALINDQQNKIAEQEEVIWHLNQIIEEKAKRINVLEDEKTRLEEDKEELEEVNHQMAASIEGHIGTIKSLREEIDADIEEIDRLEDELATYKTREESDCWLYFVGGEGRAMIELVDPSTKKVVETWLAGEYDEVAGSTKLQRL